MLAVCWSVYEGVCEVWFVSKRTSFLEVPFFVFIYRVQNGNHGKL